jgi:hypothetical protein
MTVMHRDRLLGVRRDILKDIMDPTRGSKGRLIKHTLKASHRCSDLAKKCDGPLFG